MAAGVEPGRSTLAGAPDPSRPPRRIVVVGCSGAGKTTWARELAAALGCRHIELDALFWGPGWREKPREEFCHLVAEAIVGDAWVVDGNYSAVRDLVWPRAEAVVWLNLGFVRVFSRSFTRTVARIVRREALWHGNRESFVRTFFTRQSILWWVITTFGRTRHKFATLQRNGDHAHLVWLEVRDQSQAGDCLRRLARGSAL